MTYMRHNVQYITANHKYTRGLVTGENAALTSLYAVEGGRFERRRVGALGSTSTRGGGR